MQEYQYPPNDTEPTPRLNRVALRAFLMIVIAGLVLLLVLLLLSSLVNPAAPESKVPPSLVVIEESPTPEAPRPAVVAGENASESGNVDPAIVPETGNQFIDSSGSSSGLFGQLSQEALSDFQTCADELEYTARIDDTWDIWELIFYTIYANQDNTSTTPPACQQLASEFASNGRGEFITALGAAWWPGNRILASDANPCSTAEECGLAQEAAELLMLEGSDSLVACLNGLLPPGLCAATASDYTQACIEKIDWTGPLEELQAVVLEDYRNSLGDISSECIQFVGMPFLANETTTNTNIGIQSGATCAASDVGCQAIESFDFELNQAQQCAFDMQWSGAISNDTEALELVEYLATSAPWLPPGSMSSSCTQLLLSTSPTEAGRAYWELLGKTLSERRIDTIP